MKTRIALFLIAVIGLLAVDIFITSAADPQISTELGVAQTQNSNEAATNVRLYHQTYNTIYHIAAGAMMFGAFIICFGGPIRRKFFPYPYEKQYRK